MSLLLLAALSLTDVARAEATLTTLDNGLRVYVEPRPSSPSVAIAVAVGVGSIRETSADNGAAHFLEHYLFTGTERWTEEQLQDEVERRGGDWNGRTTLSKTVYHVHLPATELAFGLDWIDQVSFRPKFDEKLFKRERNVVFQERGGRKGWTSNSIERAGFGLDVAKGLRQLLFPGTGLALNVIGEDESLDALTLDSLRGFYERYYVPSNAALLVVGGVDPAVVAALVPGIFGVHPARPAPEPLPPLPEVADRKAVVVRGPWDNDEQTLSIGVRGVGLLHPDYWGLRLLTQVVDKALTRELRQGRGLVYSVGASIATYGDTGQLSVTTSALGEHTDEIRQVVKAELDRAAAGELPAAAVEDARAYLKGVYALNLEDNFNRAWWCSDAVLQGGMPPDVEAALSAVTSEQLAAVGRRYLAPELRREALHDPVLTAYSGGLLGIGFVLGGGLLARWRLRRRG